MVNNTQTPFEQAEVSTKQRILDIAIDLYAQRGFDAVSMQDIADAVGIKKASLYYHFESKDQILKEILQYPITRINLVAPKGETEQLITQLGLEGFMSMSTSVVTSWMTDERMQKIWRILVIELYHNEEIKKFFAIFQQMSVTFWESNFNFMLSKKLIREDVDVKVLTNEYLSFFMEAYLDYFLSSYGNTSKSFLEQYKESFIQHSKFIIDAIKVKEVSK